MTAKKNILLQSALGSVFSISEQLSLETQTVETGKKVIIAGRVEKPGVVEIEDGMTLQDVITAVGGIKNKNNLRLHNLGFLLEVFSPQNTWNILLIFLFSRKMKEISLSCLRKIVSFLFPNSTLNFYRI